MTHARPKHPIGAGIPAGAGALGRKRRRSGRGTRRAVEKHFFLVTMGVLRRKETPPPVLPERKKMRSPTSNGSFVDALVWWWWWWWSIPRPAPLLHWASMKHLTPPLFSALPIFFLFSFSSLCGLAIATKKVDTFHRVMIIQAQNSWRWWYGDFSRHLTSRSFPSFSLRSMFHDVRIHRVCRRHDGRRRRRRTTRQGVARQGVIAVVYSPPPSPCGHRRGRGERGNGP